MNFFLKGDRIIAKLSGMKNMPLIVFIVAYAEGIISPILPEALLLVVLTYRKDLSWKLLSLVSAFGSSLGALTMYLLGAFFYDSYGSQVLSFFHGEGLAQKAEELFNQNVFIAQFFASLTPLPDKVFSFLAGAFLVSPLLIFLATFTGRLLRVSIVAYLAHSYGPEARVYIKKHMKTALIAALGLLILYLLYTYH